MAARAKSESRPKADRPWLFKKGQSGNPGGRPKDYVTQAIRQIVGPDDALEMARVLFALAKNGDLKAMEMVMDRVEGKAVARNENGSPGEFDGIEALKEMSSAELRKIIRLEPRSDAPESSERKAS